MMCVKTFYFYFQRYDCVILIKDLYINNNSNNMFLFGHNSADLKIHPFSFDAFFSFETLATLGPRKGQLQTNFIIIQN